MARGWGWVWGDGVSGVKHTTRSAFVEDHGRGRLSGIILSICSDHICTVDVCRAVPRPDPGASFKLIVCHPAPPFPFERQRQLSVSLLYFYLSVQVHHLVYITYNQDVQQTFVRCCRLQ